jgi:hypothetical protein
MKNRDRAFYWVEWTQFADAELVESKAGPQVGEWDARYLWFACMQTYRFDREVNVLSECLPSPEAVLAPDRTA